MFFSFFILIFTFYCTSAQSFHEFYIQTINFYENQCFWYFLAFLYILIAFYYLSNIFSFNTATTKLYTMFKMIFSFFLPIILNQKSRIIKFLDKLKLTNWPPI